MCVCVYNSNFDTKNGITLNVITIVWGEPLSLYWLTFIWNWVTFSLAFLVTSGLEFLIFSRGVDTIHFMWSTRRTFSHDEIVSSPNYDFWWFDRKLENWDFANVVCRNLRNMIKTKWIVCGQNLWRKKNLVGGISTAYLCTVQLLIRVCNRQNEMLICMRVFFSLEGIYSGKWTRERNNCWKDSAERAHTVFVERVYCRAYIITLSICWSWQIYKFIMLSILFAILIRIGMWKKKSTSQFTLQRESCAVWRWVLYSGRCR